MQPRSDAFDSFRLASQASSSRLSARQRLQVETLAEMFIALNHPR